MGLGLDSRMVIHDRRGPPQDSSQGTTQRECLSGP